MTAYLSTCSPNNASFGFDLQEVETMLSETGLLTIRGTCPLGQLWSVTIPVELLAATKAAEPGKAHG